MPIYEYQCLQCGARTEALQKMADAPLSVCEACGGELKRLISSPAVQFKGSGWYVTDYARRGGAGKSESKGAGGGEAKGDAGKGGEAASAAGGEC
jgi:putative FmdB family regulatory protein